ncbi:MAG TPA: prepilin-type N-terminal cleavage/methylation domain-containing protein [Deltaproteobacteria bacterium]|jgi:prepilin-type N-terminal cleavage/methylation domain-containing protein|nr:prepilin-type N-terminal cleavage/methylation domain-containing protein [Deltaproteobacteria bacterium]HOI05811.1 prepilin-type N-terminal cleavage/methylation domain-containing protein [Deltaproteobacteria bacterium]
MLKFRVGNRQGFTLVELALVLVIVGLLITGVLKGEALIENARMKRLVSEKDAISAAYFTFFDRYNQYPGDESLATAPPNDATNGNNNGQIVGAEVLNLFQDLQNAQILNGNYATNLPSNVYGGTISILWNAALGSNSVQLTAVPASVAAQIDLKYDDGVATTGTIRANATYGGTAPLTLTWRL